MPRRRSDMTLIDHPVVQSDLARLRDRSTTSAEFRVLVRRISIVMATEMSRSLDTRPVRVRTPLESAEGVRLRRGVALMPILRAGLGMMSGFLEVLPEAKVGHIGIYRDELTLEPVDYYLKVPRSLKGLTTIVLDPMLATGGSACAAIKALRERGARDLALAVIVSSPQGIARVRSLAPKVPLFTCAVDRALNSSGYILPGLGDAGDRYFGTI